MTDVHLARLRLLSELEAELQASTFVLRGEQEPRLGLHGPPLRSKDVLVHGQYAYFWTRAEHFPFTQLELS